jgi:hypothetical protein
LSRRRKPLVPEARDGLNQLKLNVMNQEGYQVSNAENVKVEVAEAVGVPLKKGYNGELTSRQAGNVGGPIGGRMVSELIKMAKNHLNK